MRITGERHIGFGAILPLVVALAMVAAAAVPLRSAAQAVAGDRLSRAEGAKLEGRFSFDPAFGFRFAARGEGGAPGGMQAVNVGDEIEFAAEPLGPADVPPPFLAGLGEVGRISGTLGAITEDSVTLSVDWCESPVVLRRPGIQWLTQRLGEARILADGFDAIDANLWGVVGRPRTIVDDGETALSLPPGGTSIEHRFEEPIEAGRIDLTFRDDGVVRQGQSWTLSLTFRGPSGPSPLRVLLGGGEESLAVETLDGPGLVVQRLARTDEWRRLSVRFGGDRIEISVDGKDLAHGRGPTGPLETLRIATTGEPAEDAGPGGRVGAVQVARFAPVLSSLEIDPSQDEARLILGDQLFGSIPRGDRNHLEMLVDDRPIRLAWKDLSGVHFRRTPVAGLTIAGALARVEWRAGGEDFHSPQSRRTDFAEGAVESIENDVLVLNTPFAGRLVIPRRRLVRLRVQEPGLRILIDPSSHHLGNELSSTAPLLDPAMPEGGVLERPFLVPENVVGPGFVVLDVLGVVGEATGLPFSELVRRGELKTYIAVDGKRVDYINRYITDSNEAPARIRIPVPAEALRPGPHLLRIEQTGTTDDPQEFDDLGILGAAIEFASPTAPPRP